MTGALTALPGDPIRTMAADSERVDHRLVAEYVEAGSRVLDVGCADGALLKLLQTEKQVDGRGIEISQRRVNQCVAGGLTVVQGDADNDLDMYPPGAFDFAILSQTVQATRHPDKVLDSLLNIGRKVIVSIPNFGHWRIRRQFFLGGRMPINRNLPYQWYDTPNIHFCTIRDFILLADTLGATVEQSVAIRARSGPMSGWAPLFIMNLLGEQAVFVLSRR